jgi:hypothetical protein
MTALKSQLLRSATRGRCSRNQRKELPASSVVTGCNEDSVLFHARDYYYSKHKNVNCQSNTCDEVVLHAKSFLLRVVRPSGQHNAHSSLASRVLSFQISPVSDVTHNEPKKPMMQISLICEPWLAKAPTGCRGKALPKPEKDTPWRAMELSQIQIVK